MVLRCRVDANGKLTVGTNLLVGIRDAHQHNIAVDNVLACSADCAGSKRRLLRLDSSKDQRYDKRQEDIHLAFSLSQRQSKCLWDI